jgi:hypothetical protein
MHFPKTQSRLIGNHPPFKRGRLLRDAGLETSHSKRLVYSNFGNRRSLSGQRAFSQGWKHRPDPTPDITADETARRAFL